jgi:plastocyanin
MRRLGAGVVLALLAAPLALASTPILSQGPARVQASADEFSLALSRQSVRSGTAIVELVNYGEDDHDLALRRIAPGARSYRIGIVHPGDTGELTTRLRPGRYRLWCTLADHRARGMVATLVVRPRAL